jgi:hypothetical protein
MRTTALLPLALVLSLTAVSAGPVLTVADAGSSATYAAGTNKQGFVSQSADPLAPFSGLSVTFRGWMAGGSPVTLPGSPNEYLVFRYQLDFDQPTPLFSIVLKGAAFNGAVFRLLDANQVELGRDSWPTSGNFFQTIVYSDMPFHGQRFYLEEYDRSSNWRYISDIEINTVPEPATLLLAGVSLLWAWLRRTAR